MQLRQNDQGYIYPDLVKICQCNLDWLELCDKWLENMWKKLKEEMFISLKNTNNEKIMYQSDIKEAK